MAGLASLIWLAGCGYIGEPLPPALNIPVAVTDLTAVERGDKIVIRFTVPRMTTEGLLLGRYGELNVRIGASVDPWHQPTWEDNSEGVEGTSAPAAGPMQIETPVAPWTGRDVIIGVRVSNHKGRWSGWSNFVTLKVIEQVPKPGNMHVDNVRDGIKVSWTFRDLGPGVRFSLYRRINGAEVITQVGETDQTEFIDENTEYGKTYEYSARAAIPAGNNMAESDVSEWLAITPEDLFAPTPPSGLAVVTGLDTIELAWEPSQEPDLASYNVYRSGQDGSMNVIANSLSAPKYSDRDVESGRRYRYAVSSVDKLGNESEPSAAIEQAAPIIS